MVSGEIKVPALGIAFAGRAVIEGAMKFFLIALPLCVLGVSCERHDFSETKQLHEEHGHGAHGAGHDKGHDAHGAHGDSHGEKKAEGEKH